MSTVRPAVLALALLLPASALAVPLQLSHQGRLLDSVGAPLDGVHDLTLTLYDAPAGGSNLWSEAHAPDFDAGYFSVSLGADTPLDSGVFDGRELYLGISVNGGAELPQRVPLVSVPYAVRAGSVQGGVVDASEIFVNGVQVFDAEGGLTAAISYDALPADLADGDGDTLAELSLSCVSGDVAVFDGAGWACDAGGGGGATDAGDIVSGILSIERLSIGTGANDVAAGNHTHDLADLVSGTIDPALLPATPDGSDAAHAAYDCKSIRYVNPRAKSGEYWLDPDGDGSAFKAACDMSAEGGGWFDLVGTWHIGGQDLDALTEQFFDTGSTSYGVVAEAKANVDGVAGILITWTTPPANHQAAVHFWPDDLTYSRARLDYRLQGSDFDNRCALSSWVPLNGPGFNGSYGGYLAACPSGYSCIQGQPENGRDAPIAASYAVDSLTSSSTLLTWSGSTTSSQSLNCARDAKIPVDKPALFITRLLVQ